LASIRQIISEDEDKDDSAANNAPKQSAPPPPPEPVAPPPAEPIMEPEDDVLELTDPLPPEEEPPVPRIELQDIPEDIPPVQEVESAPMPTPSHEPLLEGLARQATIASMAKLAGNMPVSRTRAHGTVTLEDIVREILHPMLRDWMNENLPPMVERIVQKELEKLARQAQDV